MAHLSFFGIDNFRVFKDLHRFEFKPMTILVGTNSSGKSSLSKGILLLKDAFEKVKYENELLNIWSLDNLSFQQNLSIGNFDNYINNHSKSDEITFELPMKFPLIDDLFSIRFTYKRADNALKNGVQKNVKIIHIDTQTEVLSHNNETGKLHIKFSFLKKKLDEIIPKVIEIHNIEEEITKLQEPFWKDRKSQILGLEGKFGRSLSQEDIPKEVQEKIAELNIKKTKVLPNYFTDNLYGFYELDSFNSTYPIYTDTLHNPHLYYTPELPLLNYSFLISDSFIKQHQKELHLNDKELLELTVKSNIIRNKLGSKANDIVEYLKNIENNCLDELNLENEGMYGRFNELLFFGATLSEIRHPSTINEMFFTKLIQKEPLFNEILDSERGISYQELGQLLGFNLLLKPSELIIPNNLKFFLDSFIYNGIGRSFNTIAGIYKSIHYIPSVRTKVDRIFRNTSDSYLQEVLQEIHQSKLSETTTDFINKYVKFFNIADEIYVNLADDSSFTKIFLLKDGLKQELADVGYGVAQILPIILKIGTLISRGEPQPEYNTFYHSSSIVIIEEPETNLHPALQSKLADMFVECYQKYNIQFIVETHSEYLIRKLQYLTAKGEFSAKDSNIYYFNDPNNIPAGEPQVKKIEILEDGSLSDDFGSGFFDEATNWKFELLQLRKAQKN
jgi:predicted ATPase